jgi:hypothetical protein
MLCKQIYFKKIIFLNTFCSLLKKGWTQHPDASDKVYQFLAQGQWFSPGTPASSTTKTGCHDIHVINDIDQSDDIFSSYLSFPAIQVFNMGYFI